MIHLFQQVESLPSAQCSARRTSSTHLHTLVVLELVGVDQQRLLTVLLFDFGIGRIDGQIEDVVRTGRELMVLPG